MSWVDVEESGSVLGMRCVIAGLRLFGRRFAGWMCEPALLYYFVTNGRARRASRHYLRRICASAEGRNALGRGPDLWASWLHFRAYGSSLIDRAAVWAGQGDRFAIDFPARAELLRVQASGRGALLIGAHLGSFDFLRAVASKKGVPVNLLVFEKNARKINAVLKAIDPLRELRAIPVVPGSIAFIFEVQACIERGEFVAVLGDRAELVSPKHAARAQFLGAEAAFPLGPLLIAHSLQCPVYLLFALATGPRAYTIRFELFAEHVRLGRAHRERELAPWLERYVRRLEELCRAHPLQWTNFYDFWGDERVVESASRSARGAQDAATPETIRT